MNTGIILRRLGESSYCRFSRFLTANQSCDIKTFKSLFQESKIHKSYLTPNNNRNTEGWLTIASRIFEEKYIKKSLLKKQKYYSKLLKGYRPKKSCNSCAKSGFHTNIFDYDWLSICPIHFEELTSRCNLCNNQWPTPHELIFKKCKQCGPMKAITRFFVDKEFSNSKLKTLNQLEQTIYKGKKTFSENIQIYNFETYDSFNRINNSESSFFLSAIKYQTQKEHIGSVINSYNILKYSFESNTYELKSSLSNYTTDYIEKKKNESINKIYSLLKNTLTVKQCCDNKCELDNFPNKVCIYCSTLYIWRTLFGKNCINNITDQKMDFFRLYNYGFMPNEPQFYTNLKIINHSQISLEINLPIKLSSIIYENDLWTSSITIYHLVKNTINKFENRINDDKEFETEIYRNNMILSKKNIFIPYFVRSSGGRIKFIYPDVKSSGLDLNNDLYNLIS